MAQKLILDGIAGMKFLIEGDLKHTGAIIKAHFSFYSKLPKYLKIRKQLKIELVNNNVIGIYKRSIAKDYFLWKQKKFSDLKEHLFSK